MFEYFRKSLYERDDGPHWRVFAKRPALQTGESVWVSFVPELVYPSQ